MNALRLGGWNWGLDTRMVSKVIAGEREQCESNIHRTYCRLDSM